MGCSVGIYYSRSLGSWNIKGNDEYFSRRNTAVPLMYHDLSDLRSWIMTRIIPNERGRNQVCQPYSSYNNSNCSISNLFLQSIPLPFLALLLAAFVCFTFRLRDENINGPEEPASELVRDFFPTGFKWVAKGWTLKDLWKVNYATFFNRNLYALNMRAASCHQASVNDQTFSSTIMFA